MFGWLKRLFRKASDRSEDHTEGQQGGAEALPVGLMGSEQSLKNSAESLIEYLRLKSKKTRIKQEKFNLNNVLNELSGSLSTDFMDSGVELIFDIDKQVSKNLVGDSLQLGKILTSLTRSLIEKDPGAEIEIKITQSTTLTAQPKLQIKILDPSVYLSREELKAFSIPYYDEQQGKYVKLEFYVTKEIVSLMGGTLEIKSTPKEGTAVLLTVPFGKDETEEKRKYRLPSKEMVGKKVFLVDSNYSSALAIKKMLAYFQYKVDILSAEYFREKKVNLSSYDIAIFDEQLLIPHVVSYLKNLKQRSGLKIVLLSSIFRSQHTDRYGALAVVDAMADKPFSQERIFEMILDLHRAAQRNEIAEMQEGTPSLPDSETKKIYRGLFENRKLIAEGGFSDFAGNRILIVDDNRINQKILLHVLGESGIYLDTANDGKEAVQKVLQAEKPYDMVLMDINMPVMDGYAATARIREYQDHDQLPIVALTTLILESEIEKMFAHGISGYLSKPLEVGRLYSACTFFLEKKREAAAGPRPENPAEQQYDGLDVARGVANAHGNTVVYKEVLREFLAAYGESAALVRNLVDSHDYAQLKLLCADIRSLTHTIGAYRMYAIADEIYKLLLYNSGEKVPQHIESYRREFKKLTQAIGSYTGGGVS